MTAVAVSQTIAGPAWSCAPTTRRPGLEAVTLDERVALPSQRNWRANLLEQIAGPARGGRTATWSAFRESTTSSWQLRADDPVRVGGYRLVSLLGSGGTADVFYAVAPDGRPVAVKLLRAAEGAAQACRREYQILSTVDPRCTAAPLGCGVSSAGSYLVTTYLPGYRSASTLVGAALPLNRLWALGSALVGVLADIHARGVVHCDLKPSNLLVLDDAVRLIDFGIARYVGEQSADDGMVQCTRGWAAPEQLRRAVATPAVDVFAWGCLLAYLANGIHPFAARSEREWILRVQLAQPDLQTLPAVLAAVVRAAVARDPRDRPSARELATICRSAESS